MEEILGKKGGGRKLEEDLGEERRGVLEISRRGKGGVFGIDREEKSDKSVEI